jgi:GNAT superfamily N-acetyltransferase
VSGAPLGAVQSLSERHHTRQFDCGVRELDEWLEHSALTAAAAGTAATYVLCRGDHVVGYYALAMGSVAHHGAPSRLRRGMPDPVPVVLLARLALDRSEHGNSLGGHLLVDALRRCVRGGKQFGARAVILDAINDQAVRFYQHFGFHTLEDRRLWRRLSDIARGLGD